MIFVLEGFLESNALVNMLMYGSHSYEIEP